MKYKKIWKYQPYRTSRREQDYQQVQEFLKSGDPELWKALYECSATRFLRNSDRIIEKK